MADAALLEAETPIMSVEDYLDFENASDTKHEFVNGIVYAMVGVRDRHNLISLELAAALLSRVPPRCQVFTTDMKLRVRTVRDEYFYYPDVFVSCSAADREPYWREEPVLIIEILSPSTERIDRSEKAVVYRQIASLSEYVLLSQDRIRAEIFRRRTGWEREVIDEGSLVLESVDVTLAVEDLYRRTDLVAT